MFLFILASLSLSFRDRVKLFAEASQQIFIYVALATHASSSHPQSNYWKEGWGHFAAVSSHPLKLGAEVLSGWSKLPPEIKSGSHKHREKGRDGSWVGSQHICLCTFSMSVFPTEYTQYDAISSYILRDNSYTVPILCFVLTKSYSCLYLKI